ncbi:hypothetical protein GCM10007269_01620 [Microbacterium murale]|uniref:Uncharacterized protein n=2 Tax=Microbacterium murale TaxID=1081040 RepID=A0ABQ1RB74_9MICO|nr:hypothetical protein GCM10007269_01620 [Microbacterium murale]
MPDAEDLTQFAHASEATLQQPADILDDMTDWIEQLMQLVLSALGLFNMPDLASLDLAALSLAVALLAVTALVVAITLGVVRTGQGSAPHPLRAIGRSVLLSQSDPDAAGHPRPRAPGVVRAA